MPRSFTKRAAMQNPNVVLDARCAIVRSVSGAPAEEAKIGKAERITPVRPITVTVPVACLLSGITPKVMLEMIRADEIKAAQVGRRILVYLDQLEAYLRAHEYQPGEDDQAA